METPPLPTEQAELMKAEALSADAKLALSRGGLHPTLLGVQSALVAFPIIEALPAAVSLLETY
jgi:hypothetical protein